MNQPALFHEDIWQALRDCVSALGGAKVVGDKLRPEIGPEKSGRWLLDCLNPDKQDKLSVEQLLLILAEARKANCHVAAHYIAQVTGYAEPQPVEPEDERAALQRMFVESVRQQNEILKRFERLGRAA
jgi:hypothetical protein